MEADAEADVLARGRLHEGAGGGCSRSDSRQLEPDELAAII